MNKNEKTIIYRGVYRGVNWEINNIFKDYKGISSPYLKTDWWTYYLKLRKDMMTKEDFAKFNLKAKKFTSGRERKYYPVEDIPDVDFHGGCTFCEKEIDKVVGKHLITIGCDYNHSWDEGKNYTIESIYYDVKKSIDSFLAQFGYKRWCGTCGDIVDLEAGVVRDSDESAYSFVCSKCDKSSDK